MLVPARLGITKHMGSLLCHRAPVINGSKDAAIICNCHEHTTGKALPVDEEPGLATETRLHILGYWTSKWNFSLPQFFHFLFRLPVLIHQTPLKWKQIWCETYMIQTSDWNKCVINCCQLDNLMSNSYPGVKTAHWIYGIQTHTIQP